MSTAPASRHRAPASPTRDASSGDRRLHLDDILKLAIADGLVSRRRRGRRRACTDAALRASAGAHRRPQAALGKAAPRDADARSARGVAGRQARRALPAHRPVAHRRVGSDADDVDRLRRALPHPAGGRGARHAHRSDGAAVRAGVGGRAREDPEAARGVRLREPRRHPALPRRVLQSRALDEEGARSRARASSRWRATSSSWSSWASAAPSTPTTSTSSTSSTGCCSTPSTSARATSTSSRGATSGMVRFRIDGVLHQVYEIPIAGAERDDQSRIKMLAPHGRSSRSAARRTGASRP